jgi:hypothetical protein
VNHLAVQVYGEMGQAPAHLPTDKALWNDFVVAFWRQFQDTAEAERAWAKLQSLEMKGDTIDDYIVEFENLLKIAGRDRHDLGSMDYFKQELPTSLHCDLLWLRPLPATLDDWQWQARSKVEIWALTKASLGEKPKNWLSSRQSCWNATPKAAAPKPSSGKPPRDPEAMDVDAAWTTGLSKEEHVKLQKERKCFLCKKEGHIARNCSSQQKGKEKRQESKAQTTKVEEVVDDREEKDKTPGSSKSKEDLPPEYDNEERLEKAM